MPKAKSQKPQSAEKGTKPDSKLTQSVLGKIDASHLKPESKNKIFYKSAALYLSLAAILGILSLMLLVSANTFKRNLFLESTFRGDGLGGIFFAVPWPLVIAGCLGLLALSLIISKTEAGYHYRKILLIPVVLIILSLVAGLIYAGGIRHGLKDGYNLQRLEDDDLSRFRGRVIEIDNQGSTLNFKIEDGPGRQLSIKLNDDTECMPDDCDEIKLGQPIAGWAEKDGQDLLAKEVQTRGPRQGPPPRD